MPHLPEPRWGWLPRLLLLRLYPDLSPNYPRPHLKVILAAPDLGPGQVQTLVFRFSLILLEQNQQMLQIRLHHILMSEHVNLG